MKKEELLKKVDGLTDAQAEKICELYSMYIPKSRFDEVNEAKKTAESLLKERDNQLEEFKKANEANEELKKQIEKMQSDNESAIKAKDAEIKAIRVNTAVEIALKNAGAINNKAILPFVDVSNAEIDENGVIKGLDKQIENLKADEATKFLFKQDSDNDPKFRGMSKNSGNQDKNKTLTQADFNRMSYKERNELYNTNKDLYDALSSANNLN